MITTDENALLRRCIENERSRLQGIIDHLKPIIDDRNKAAVEAEIEKLGALWTKLNNAVPATPDATATEAAKKAWDKLCYEIDYAVMSDDRPEIYEQAIAILSDKAAKRAAAFRDARD